MARVCSIGISHRRIQYVARVCSIGISHRRIQYAGRLTLKFLEPDNTGNAVRPRTAATNSTRVKKNSGGDERQTARLNLNLATQFSLERRKWVKIPIRKSSWRDVQTPAGRCRNVQPKTRPQPRGNPKTVARVCAALATQFELVPIHEMLNQAKSECAGSSKLSAREDGHR